ncbi:unnamed protein product [Dibothriocephalus latus]|uniref:Vacuolar membrane-associated protein Iml1 N-terminal domain-containing protein n=1 Tax=Dibothriocephalus latus TaxID=60516 RepID=A0A3P7LNF0_DIBLA|nr:unnamed protein product [Dibothriocephalus latus]
MRGHISELWRKGEPASCGYVSNQTKVVFRSNTAVIHLFIQMSNEMWNFDEFGDLYFEKAVKFLRELFLNRWTESNCVHDVTLVLFSRIYVNLNPEDLRIADLLNKTVICKDEKGQLYTDFYKVLVQNERFTPEEWRRTLTQLLLEFRIFQSELRQYILSTLEDIKYPQDVTIRLPPAREGNVLEALNLTLTLYEEYNIDRNFDRTGKVCVIVTPGSGVFDASRDLISLSKQRSLDLGVTVDLVCLGTQPLHAVPLLVCRDSQKPGFQGKSYIVPHWINHRFPEHAELRPHSFADLCAASDRSSPQSHSSCTGTIRNNFGAGHVGDTSHTRADIKRICELANAVAGKAAVATSVESCAAAEISVMKVATQSIEHTRHQDTDISAPQRKCSISIDEGVPAGWSIQRRKESIQSKNTMESQICGAVLCNILDPLCQGQMAFGTEWMSLYGYPWSGVQHQLNRYPVANSNSTGRINRAICGKGGLSVAMSQEMLLHTDPYARGLRGDDLPVRDRKYKFSTPAFGSQLLSTSVKADTWLSLQSQYVRAPLHSAIASGNSGNSSNNKTALAAFKTFPFGINPHLFGLRRTAGQRRWAHFHAVAYRSHQNAFENSHCLLVLEGEKPCLNLSKVWHAYFDFCRHALRTLLLQAFTPEVPASADVFFSSEMDSVMNLPRLKAPSST